MNVNPDRNRQRCVSTNQSRQKQQVRYRYTGEHFIMPHKRNILGNCIYRKVPILQNIVLLHYFNYVPIVTYRFGFQIQHRHLSDSIDHCLHGLLSIHGATITRWYKRVLHGYRYSNFKNFCFISGYRQYVRTQ